MFRRHLLPAALAIALTLGFAAGASADYSYYPPSPSGVALEVSRPVFSQVIISSAGTSVTCRLGFLGQSVVMPYVASESACVYTWPTALAPGTYTAQIDVTAPGYSPLSQPLQFSVAPGAMQSLPPASLATLETLRIMNYVRSQEGLPTLTADMALQAASQAHASYFIQNQSLYGTSTSMHSEPSSTAAGYTGAMPSQRDAAFGAIGGGSEVMASGTPTVAWNLVGLMDTTFHRFILLDPTIGSIGGGYAASPVSAANATEAFVADLGSTGSGKTPLAVMFPWNGEQHVQTAFFGELPDPLAGIAPQSTTSAYPESGYPVSVTFDPSQVSQVNVTTASLNGPGGTPLPTYLVDQSTYQDQNATYSGESMGTSVALFPQAPLAYNTAYKADIQGTLTMLSGSTQPFTETWSFTTVQGPTVTRAFQDGGYLFVVGQNLENATVSSYSWLQGNPNVGSLVYAGSHYLAYTLTGSLTNVQVTDGSTNAVLGNYPVSSRPFSDTGVSASSLYAIDGASAAGLVEGFPDRTFRPDANVTGAQAITMLYRALGSPALAPGTTPPAGIPAYAQSAVAWADANGVIQSGDGFRPYEDATRAQLTTWLLRAYGIPAATTSPSFSDASQIPAAMRGYVAAAQADGVVSGYPDGTFRPQSAVSRGAFAVWTLRLAQAMQSPQGLF